MTFFHNPEPGAPEPDPPPKDPSKGSDQKTFHYEEHRGQRGVFVILDDKGSGAIIGGVTVAEVDDQFRTEHLPRVSRIFRGPQGFVLKPIKGF